MPTRASSAPVARLVDPLAAETLDVVGAVVQFLTPPEEGAPCVIRGTIPPGGVVPLHSHGDPETFLALSGDVEGLVHSARGFEWVRVAPGDVFHVPGGAKHAWRNRTQSPAINMIVTTAKIGRFFREIGTPIEPGSTPGRPPSKEAIERLLDTAERYGYWTATPEESAAVGLPQPAE